MTSVDRRPAAAGPAVPRRLGWSWAFCLALLAVVEVILHLLPDRIMFSFDQHAYKQWQAMDYVTVNRRLGAGARTDLLIIGSSKPREAVAPPLLAEEMKRLGADPGVVRSFACADASAPTVHALVRQLHRRGLMPQVLVYGVTPRQIRRRDDPRINQAYFLGPLDLFADDVHVPRRDRLRFFTVILCATATRYVRTLWLRELVRAPSEAPGSAGGGFTGEQLASRRFAAQQREDSLVTRPWTPARVREYVTAIGGGPFRLGNEAKAAVEDLVRLAIGGGARLIIVEMPVAPMLVAAFPEGLYAEHLAFFTGLAARTGARFVRLGEVGATLTNAEMRDLSHANWSGAVKFTTALARVLATDPVYRAAADRK